MKILFLDQSGELGGAELCLLDIVKSFRDCCSVGLLSDGSFRKILEQQDVSVYLLADGIIKVRKDSSFFQSLYNSNALISPILKIAKLSREFDIIYANTPKALVVGSIASLISRRPLVYHLHDIISPDHFSRVNRFLIVLLANRIAVKVIANSEATRSAFVEAGGRAELVSVLYNGFNLEQYPSAPPSECYKEELSLSNRFIVGHFSRLSPWKGQHVLIEALIYCPEDVTAILVGDALFGEHEYVEQLHRQVEQLNLGDRVRFLGFQSEVPQLMSACNLIAHTSTAPEPFGRVIVEGMLCGRPVVAAAAGGAVELIEPGTTGWLCPPGDAQKLAEIILECRNNPDRSHEIAQQGRQQARDQFQLSKIQQQLDELLKQLS